jgi:hypothetical protein
MRNTRVVVCCAVAATACTPLSCDRVGGAPMLEYQLFFGRASVTDQEWSDFAARVVTPKLPDGFTAFDANGQWMNPDTHRISQERTRVVIVAVPDTPVARSAIALIKNEYRQRFHQISVGTVIHPVCGAF